MVVGEFKSPGGQSAPAVGQLSVVVRLARL